MSDAGGSVSGPNADNPWLFRLEARSALDAADVQDAVVRGLRAGAGLARH